MKELGTRYFSTRLSRKRSGSNSSAGIKCQPSAGRNDWTRPHTCWSPEVGSSVHQPCKIVDFSVWWDVNRFPSIECRPKSSSSRISDVRGATEGASSASYSPPTASKLARLGTAAASLGRSLAESRIVVKTTHHSTPLGDISSPSGSHGRPFRQTRGFPTPHH